MARKRAASKGELAELSGLELEVMDVVWDLGDCSSAEVIAAFAEKRPLAETTIRTVLANLRKKEYLEAIPTIERGFRVRPRVSREVVASRSLRGIVGRLFHGSPRLAIVHLLKNESFAADDLEEIRRLIERSKGDSRR